MTRTRLLPPLALLLLALAACGGAEEPESTGSAPAAGPPDRQTATVVGNKALEFVPSTVTAAPGSLTLTMQVEGGVPHDLAFRDESVGEPIAQTATGGTGTYRFPEPGTYDFVCTLHPGMEGEVVVGES